MIYEFLAMAVVLAGMVAVIAVGFAEDRREFERLVRKVSG